MMKPQLFVYLTLVTLALFQIVRAQEPPAATIRAGMVGLDTSHVPALVELFAFVEAADGSNCRGGVPVSLPDVLAKARAEAALKS